MPQIPLQMGDDEESARLWLLSLADLVNRGIGLGVFPSTSDNVFGQPVEVDVPVASLGTQVTVLHGLGVPHPTTISSWTTATGPLNVRWLLCGVQTLGLATTTAVATSTFGVVYDQGTITPNTVDLKFTSSLATGSLRYSLLMVPAAG